MVKTRTFLFVFFLLIPVIALRARQDSPAPRLEITGVNATQMPTVTVTANVYDPLGQPIRGLTEADFTLIGDLVGLAQITNVENISDDDLPFATVLSIDTSSSMIGTPIENARRAAHAFVDNIGPNDPVAIMTFDTQVLVAQDYTTDKAALHAVIDALQAGGETALYQGAYEAVLHAANSPTPRRAVVLLGDGAEYGGRSQVGREAAVTEALARGVPVYTIGLGFGADRTYLQQLSSSTNARSYETPTPEQLTQIYTDLAALLRSQYVLTLDAPLPLDGTQYNLRLQVATAQGSAEAVAVLRAPIPVPVVRLQRFDAPLTEPTDILATVLADDAITSMAFQFGDSEPVTLTGTPYVFTVEPAAFAPGDYILTATATDEDGDQGSDVITLTIGALPSQVSLSPALASLGAIDEPATIAVETSGQTPTTAVSIAFNDAAPTELTEPYSFTIDPLQLPPGENAVTLSVTNEGGVTSAQTFAFTVAALPPQVRLVGLEAGQTIEAPTTFSVEITAQEDIAQVSVSVDERVIAANADGTFTLNPIQYAPGIHTMTVSALTVGGRSGTINVSVVIAELPPQIIVTGLTPGETLSQDRAVTFDFVTQVPVIHVAVFVDGVDLAHLVNTPFGTTLRVLDFAPGDHVLRVVADTSSGQSSTLDVPFSIAPEPAVTATQAAVASATRQAQSTAVAVEATQAALSVQATGTQIASASETAAAVMATQFAQATQVAQTTSTQFANASATVAALSTQAAQAAQTTRVAFAATNTRGAIDTAATANAQATQAVQATATQEAANATGTQTRIEAEATQTAQIALNETATQVKIEATQTQNAAASATNAAVTATDAARATQLAVDLATLEARITATAQVAQATFTQQALIAATGDALTTQQAITEATGTAVIVATANQLATQAADEQQATRASEATQSAISASATQDAQSTATQIAQATLDTRATRNAIAVAQAQLATRSALATANAEARLIAQATQNARATRSVQQATATQAALEATATAEAENTLSALEATATQFVVNATATRHALETQTADESEATQIAREATATLEAEATSVAQATVNAQQTQSAAATRERGALLTVTAQQLSNLATATADAQATQSAAATLNAIALATDVQTTQVAQAALAQATVNAQSTIDTRLTAVGPTATPIGGGEQGAPTEATTPQPTPTLTEIQAQEPPASSNLAPILIVVIVILVIIVVLVLVMRGRGTPPTTRR